MRRPIRSALVAVLATAAFAGPAAAAAVTVAVDHNVKLPLAGPAGSVVVGNPTVADVTVVDSRTVFVSGRGPGSTDVTVVDPLGRTVFAGDIRVVSEPGAHVVIHRGALQRADMSCDPTCTPSAATAASAAHGGTDAPASPGNVVANVLGGAVVGAASGAATAAVGGGRPS